MKTNFAIFLVGLGLVVGTASCKLTTGLLSPSPSPGASAEYLFATSNNQVWSFSVNSSTGALSAAAGVTGPALSYGILGDPAGKYLYVSDTVTDTVHVYSISTTGSLTEITASPYSVGTAVAAPSYNATGLAMDSSGRFLYAADDANNAIAAFTVNSSTGALTTVSGAPFTTGSTTQPVQVVVDGSNSFLYSSDVASPLGGVSAFTLNGSGGLGAVPGFSPFTTLQNGEPVGLTTTGKYLYVAEEFSGKLVALSINNIGGLAPVPNSPYVVGNNPVGVAVTPSGKYLYVANNGDSTISAYSTDSTTGELTAINGSPFAAGASPWYLTVDPSGQFLYATNPTANTITGFTINSSTGGLTEFSGSATTVGTQPIALTVVTVQ
jgi:VCBS repeat-containing protein